MKILGLDLGSKTLGIALSDKSGILASGIETYTFEENNYLDAIDYILKFISNNIVEKIVLGYPKNMDGSIGYQGKTCEEFKEMIKKNLDIEVVLWDERLTSRIVNNVMINANLSRKKRKKQIDKLAATIILQSYLDSKKREV